MKPTVSDRILRDNKASVATWLVFGAFFQLRAWTAAPRTTNVSARLFGDSEDVRSEPLAGLSTSILFIAELEGRNET